MTTRVSLLLLGVLASASLGCATTAPRKEVVWPPPPDTARIRFVKAFRHNDDFDDSASARLLRTLRGPSMDPPLGRPMGLALSPNGARLYVADPGRGMLFVADFQANTLKPFAPDEPVGTPHGIAVDADENVYVADSAGREVIVFSKEGDRLRAFGSKDGLERPFGLALDRQRRLLYVSDPASLGSDAHRIAVFNLEGQHLRDIGEKGNADGQVYFPLFLTLDSRGRLYVADSMNFRVQVFDPEGRFLAKFGENGNGPGTFARLKGIAVDGFDNLYVVDGEHAVVQLFNASFQALMFFGGDAQKLEYLQLPSGIAIDPATNRIYVANELMARINVYELINTRREDSMSPPAGTPQRPGAEEASRGAP